MFCFYLFLDNPLLTALENQTDASVAYLAVNPASSSYRLIADSHGNRLHYICKFSGHSIFMFDR